MDEKKQTHLISSPRFRNTNSMSWFRCCRKKEFASRTVWFGATPGPNSATTAAASAKFPPNVIRNQKYSVVTFLPLVLYNQFKFFLNLFFLIMAVSQFIPQLRFVVVKRNTFRPKYLTLSKIICFLEPISVKT